MSFVNTPLLSNSYRHTMPPAQQPPSPNHSSDTPPHSRLDLTILGFFNPTAKPPHDEYEPTYGHFTDGDRLVITEIAIFIARLQDYARAFPTDPIVEDWWMCLEGEALAWWKEDLSELERARISQGTIEEIIHLLRITFARSVSDCEEELKKMSFTLEDVFKGQSVVDFVTNARCLTASTFTPDEFQINAIWNVLSIEVQDALVKARPEANDPTITFEAWVSRVIKGVPRLRDAAVLWARDEVYSRMVANLMAQLEEIQSRTVSRRLNAF